MEILTKDLLTDYIKHLNPDYTAVPVTHYQTDGTRCELEFSYFAWGHFDKVRETVSLWDVVAFAYKASKL